MGTTNRNSQKTSAARSNQRGKFNYEDIARQHATRRGSSLSLPTLLLWLLGGVALLVLIVELRRPARPSSPSASSQRSDTAAKINQTNAGMPTPSLETPHASARIPLSQAQAMPMSVPQAASPSDTPPDHSVKVTLTRDHSGNYVGTGMINNKNVKLLVDTGASVVVIPEAIARQIGLKKGQAMNFKTAGGITPHYATVLETLIIGQIQISQVAAAINPAMQEDFVLLGMNALGLLQFKQEEGKLVLSYDPDKAAGAVSETTESEEPVPFKRSVEECAGATRTFNQQTLSCLQGH